MAQRKMIKTTRIDVDGKQVTVGVLRKQETTRLMEAPFVVRDFNKEHGTNLKLISPKTADHLLLKTHDWILVEDAFHSPVDAAVAYENPWGRLGAEIVFEDHGEKVVLPTGRHKGEKGIALVVMDVTAEDIQRDGKEYRIEVPEERLVVVPAFPSEDWWYMPHAETLLPHGDMVFNVPQRTCELSQKGDVTKTKVFGGYTDARYLWRIQGGPMWASWSGNSSGQASTHISLRLLVSESP